MRRRTFAGVLAVTFASGVGAGVAGQWFLVPPHPVHDEPAGPFPPAQSQSHEWKPRPPHYWKPVRWKDFPYTDDEVRAVARRWGVPSPDPAGRLNVVPQGGATMAAIFATLGIDQSRLDRPWFWLDNKAIFTAWEVSPSYDLELTSSVFAQPEAEKDESKRLYFCVLIRQRGE